MSRELPIKGDAALCERFFTAFADPVNEPFEFGGSNGGAIVLVHGFPSSPRESRCLAALLNAHGWTTHGVLLPGFGGQARSMANYSADDWVAAVTDRIAKLRQEHRKVVLVGHSMGGAVVTEAARRVQVDGVVLLAPFAWKEPVVVTTFWGIVRLFSPTYFKPFKKTNFDTQRARNTIDRFFPGADVSDEATRRALRQVGMKKSLLLEVRRIGTEPYRVPFPNIPMLLMQGDADPVVKPESTRKLRRAVFADATYLELPAEHDLPYDDRPAWNAVRDALLTFTDAVLNDADSHL
ncbi:MAG: alpha/beta fold hydrolase [Candidatus Poribacteria bacterium]|nr:alpha/beta fold hydrolase [Candidatus Poribacteria bacterium]